MRRRIRAARTAKSCWLGLSRGLGLSVRPLQVLVLYLNREKGVEASAVPSARKVNANADTDPRANTGGTTPPIRPGATAPRPTSPTCRPAPPSASQPGRWMRMDIRTAQLWARNLVPDAASKGPRRPIMAQQGPTARLPLALLARARMPPAQGEQPAAAEHQGPAR